MGGSEDSMGGFYDSSMNRFHDDAYLDAIERQAVSRPVPPRGPFEFPGRLEMWRLTRDLTKAKKHAQKTNQIFEGEFKFTLRHSLQSSGGWLTMPHLTEADTAEIMSVLAARLAKTGLELVDIDLKGWSFGDGGQTYGVIVTVS
jgi:hypothetical protein